ncbi:hypothetical protein SLE2022_008950 [Rubroshorea leprosula]
MELAKASSLATLLVFENTINRELIRSLHVYRLADGKENEVEREFVFKRNGPYAEMAANPLLKLQKFRVSELSEGKVTGLWLCIFAFHADGPPHRIPPLLSISRNPKLKSIPNLFSDLEMILQCGCGAEDVLISGVSSEGTIEEDGDNQSQSSRRLPVFDQDLNFLPNSAPTSELSEPEKAEQGHTGIVMVKKKRATSKDIARIAMEDLAKYFDLPIVEASKSLKVGVTVLKKKCRELGIPRWPHRKIKSLDGLIRDLQEEAAQWQHEDEAAAFAVAKRRMMLETEKEIIERKPFIELQSETKQFRQDVFKRRHKARALKKAMSFSSPNLGH